MILNFTSHSVCKPFLSEKPDFMIKTLKVQTLPEMLSVILRALNLRMQLFVSSHMSLSLLLLLFCFL